MTGGIFVPVVNLLVPALYFYPSGLSQNGALFNFRGKQTIDSLLLPFMDLAQ